MSDPKSQTNAPLPQQTQQGPSVTDVMKKWRNDIKLAFSDSEEITLKIVTIYEKQLLASGEQLQNNAKEITRLQEICKKNNIDFQPPKPKGPNRKERRAVDKASKKSK